MKCVQIIWKLIGCDKNMESINIKSRNNKRTDGKMNSNYFTRRHSKSLWMTAFYTNHSSTTKKRLYLIVQTPFKSTKNLGFSKLSMSQYQDFKINALLLQKTKGLDSHHHQLSLSWSPKNGSHDSLSIPINKT